MIHMAARRREIIPDPNSPGALSVSDGTTTVGTVVERDHSFFAFDADGTLLGEFRSRRQALRSIPKQIDDSPAAQSIIQKGQSQ